MREPATGTLRQAELEAASSRSSVLAQEARSVRPRISGRFVEYIQLLSLLNSLHAIPHGRRAGNCGPESSASSKCKGLEPRGVGVPGRGRSELRQLAGDGELQRVSDHDRKAGEGTRS